MAQDIVDEPLASLAPLLGTWVLGSDTAGLVTYRVLNGGYFLVQEFDISLFGQSIQGLELIGRLKPFGAEAGPELRSRVYDNAGNTLDYVYELVGDELTIWGGEKGSTSYFKGRFSADGTTNAGQWVYPGGGYRSTMTRVASEGGLS